MDGRQYSIRPPSLMVNSPNPGNEPEPKKGGKVWTLAKIISMLCVCLWSSDFFNFLLCLRRLLTCFSDQIHSQRNPCKRRLTVDTGGIGGRGGSGGCNARGVDPYVSTSTTSGIIVITLFWFHFISRRHHCSQRVGIELQEARLFIISMGTQGHAALCWEDIYMNAHNVVFSVLRDI